MPPLTNGVHYRISLVYSSVLILLSPHEVLIFAFRDLTLSVYEIQLSLAQVLFFQDVKTFVTASLNSLLNFGRISLVIALSTELLKRASSPEFVGEIRFREFAKLVI